MVQKLLAFIHTVLEKLGVWKKPVIAPLPPSTQNPTLLTLARARERYGEISYGIWHAEAAWCSLLDISSIVGNTWINSASGQPVKHIYCNKDMQEPLLQVLKTLQLAGMLSLLKTFDGCLSVRSVRGYDHVVSWHSYGLACDINAKENPLGGPSSWPPEFVKIWTDVGFLWGGDFHRNDPMHFQWAVG